MRQSITLPCLPFQVTVDPRRSMQVAQVLLVLSFICITTSFIVSMNHLKTLFAVPFMPSYFANTPILRLRTTTFSNTTTIRLRIITHSKILKTLGA